MSLPVVYLGWVRWIGAPEGCIQYGCVWARL